jgi:translation initiation factor IF-2
MLMVLLKHSDSFSKLSTEEIQIQYYSIKVSIKETDVMLASTSDTSLGFNVRPAGNARQLADKEIDIRYYSIICSNR